MATERWLEAQKRVIDAMDRLDRDRLWRELEALARTPDQLSRLGEALGEAGVRRAIHLLTTGEPSIAPRLLARPLAALARTRESTSSLVLYLVRQWRRAAPQDAPSTFYLAIGECGAARSLEALIEGKVYGDPPTRVAVAGGLGRISPTHALFPEARLVLADLLLHDRELEVRKAAAEALEAHFSDLDQPALLRVSLEPDPSLRGTLKALWARRTGAAQGSSAGARPSVASVPPPPPVVPAAAAPPPAPATVSALATASTGRPAVTLEAPPAPALEVVDKGRKLRFYVRQLGPGRSRAFFREFERSGRPFAAEGSEDREPIDPFFTRKQRTLDGRTLYTLHDGVTMTELIDGSLILPIGRHDWRTRNSDTGVVTLRVPVDQPFEPRGTLTWRPDGSLEILLDDGSQEEEYPDGRRVLITPLGLIQTVSPRSDQGIQTDTRPDLLEKQTAHHYVLLEHPDGSLELFGGHEIPIPVPPGAVRASRLPFGAVRIEHRDGRITREVVAGEIAHPLVGGRTATFVPRTEPGPVNGVKTFKPGGMVVLTYQDGTEVEVTPEGTRRYRLPDGERVG